MSRWFTSDEHYSHVSVLRLSGRNFDDLEHMHHEFVRRHNAVVRPEDVTYHLGDFAFREQMIPMLLKAMNGRHRLIVGNHDKAHPIHKKHKKACERYLDYGFESVAVREQIEIAGMPVLLCHFPYWIDDEQRYAEHRPLDRGQVLLCGHSHSAWKVRPRQLNVGVDCWNFTPVSEDAVAEIVCEMRRAA